MRTPKIILTLVALVAVALVGRRMMHAPKDTKVAAGETAVPHAVQNPVRAVLAYVAMPAVDASIGPGEVPAGSPASPSDEVRRRLVADGLHSRRDYAELRVLVQKTVRELESGEHAPLLGEVGAWAARHNVAWGLELASGLEDFRARASLVGAMVETAVGLDPQSAGEWVADVTDPALRDSAYQKVALKWAESDLAAAKSWATNLGEVPARTSAFEGLMWTWAQRDGGAAYEWAAGISEPEIRDRVLVKLAKMMAVQEPQQAVQWALQFPEGQAREQALHYAIFQWAARDLGAATEWSAKLTDKGLQAGSDVAIARSWSNQEAQGATVWAAGIADPAGRAIALATTLQKWAEINPAAAADWLVHQPATPASEVLFRSVTGALANTHPAATGIWLSGVVDPAWRAEGEKILAQRRGESGPKRLAPKG